MNNILTFILVIILCIMLLKNNKIKEHFHYLYPNRLLNRFYPLYIGMHNYLRDTNYFYDYHQNRYYTYNQLTGMRNYGYGNFPYFSYPFMRTTVTYKKTQL